MKFSYTALTPDNQKTTGVLDLESYNEAQKELHKMGVAILALNEISDQDYQSLKNKPTSTQELPGIKTFCFIGKDPQNKEIKGTIDADNEFSAYKRLRLEYNFKIEQLSLIQEGFSDQLIDPKKLKIFESQLPRQSESNKILNESNEQGEKLNTQLIKGVDQMIENVKKGLQNYPDLYSSDSLNQIKQKLNELERIRTSNNVKHITELSQELYRLIETPDQIDNQNDGQYKSFIHQIGSSDVLKGQSEIYQKAVELSGAKRLFKKINTFFKKPRAITPPKNTVDNPKPETNEVKQTLNKSRSIPDVEVSAKAKPSKHDFTFLFIEIDSFIAWLLSFYLIYFFLINFSVEKNIGLNQKFVFKTIQNPLILNITLLLLLSHFTLRLRNLHLRHKVIANLFLFCFVLGLYTFIVINF